MAVNKGDGVRIDIDRLESSLKDIMSHDLVMSPNCCIFKTPSILKRHNERAYVPDAFSIGPLHHGSPNLKETEKIKAKYLQCLISRSHFPDTMLRTMVSSIMEVEKKARECYAEAIAYNAEELVKILVTDGCFLIELFRINTYRWLSEARDPIFSRSIMLQFLYHDLILLENQVPWMVLEILFDLTKDSTRLKSLNVVAMDFFESVYFSNRMPPSEQVNNIKGIKHFVDLFWKISTLSSTDPQPDPCINIECIKHFEDPYRELSTSSTTLFRKWSSSSTLFGKLSTFSCTLFGKLSTFSCTLFRISSTKEVKEIEQGWEFLPSATSLVESGIKFKRSTSLNLLDIKFSNGVLEIPSFQIEETTETTFRNLISYEQCYPSCEHRITSYAILLDNLINTAKDIDILCEKKIIDNWLNSEDAAQLFNKLYMDTCVAYCYTDFCGKVNRFCQRRLPKWRAGLVRNYFNSPWATASTLAAVVLLILSLLQTVFTIKR